MRSERSGRLPAGEGAGGGVRRLVLGLPGLQCPLVAVAGALGVQPLTAPLPTCPPALPPPPSTGLTFLSLHPPPTALCSLPSHRSCGHPGLRLSSLYNLLNDGERGREGGEVQEDSCGEGRAGSCSHLPWPLGPCAGVEPPPRQAAQELASRSPWGDAAGAERGFGVCPAWFWGLTGFAYFLGIENKRLLAEVQA